jgi:hypothetical protein
LHPEHGTSPSAAPPLEPDDHSAVDADVSAAEDTSAEDGSGAGDPGFSGPSDSFI